MPRRHAERVGERPPRPTTPPRDPRVYYYRARLLHHLREICPEELSLFPHPSTFTVWRGVAEDSQEFRAIEIGRVWPTNTAQEAEGTGPERLFVVDRGAYDSDHPDLVPYTMYGEGQRFIVEANGFAPIGVFENFRQLHDNQIINPRLDNPLVMSLIQFISILRDVRRYYSYTGHHEADFRAHLAPLVEAIRTVTARSGDASRRLSPLVDGSERPGMPYSQGPIGPRMDPRLAAKSQVLPTTERTATSNDNTNGHGDHDIAAEWARRNANGRFILVPAHGVVADGASGDVTMTETSTPDESTPDRTGHGSSTSPPSDGGNDAI